MKDVAWVRRNFGFIAMIHFIWDSTIRWIRRLLNRVSRKRFPIRFEDLTDADAQMTAWVAGVPNWQYLDRRDLNQAWNDFLQSKTVH